VNNIDRLYSTMLGSAGTLDVDMQREIARYATRHEKTQLMVQLVTRRDVDTEVEKELSELNDLVVLSAWASKSTRTSEELRDRMAKEKRAGALKPLAELENMPREVYEHVAKSPAVSIAKVIVRNGSIPKDIRIEKMRFLAGRKQRESYSLLGDFKQLIGGDEELARAALQEATHVAILHAALDVYEPNNTEIVALLGKLKSTLATRRYSYYGSNSLSSILKAVAPLDMTERTKEKFVEFIKEYKAIHGSNSHTWRTSGMSKLYEEFTNPGGGFTGALRKMKEATTLSELEAATAKAKKHALDTHDTILMATALLENPVSSDELLLAHAVGIRGGRKIETLRTLLDAKRYNIAARVLYEDYIHETVDLGEHARPMLIEIARISKEEKKPLPSWFSGMPIVRNDPELAIEVLPWNKLLDLMSTRVGENSSLTSAVRLCISEALGDDTARWNMFEKLGTNYEQTLPDLLTTVELLAQAETPDQETE